MNIQPGSIIHWGDPGEVQFTGKVLTVSGNGKLFVRITFPSNIKPNTIIITQKQVYSIEVTS